MAGFMQSLALNLFQRALRTGSSGDATLAWELMHLDAILGSIDLTPNPEDPPWPWPWPDPIGPVSDLSILTQMNSDLIGELIRAMGDPHPEPNNLSIFRDNKIRMQAAKNVRGRLEKGIKAMDDILKGPG